MTTETKIKMNKGLLIVLTFLTFACERSIVSPELKTQEYAHEVYVVETGLISKLKPQVQCNKLLSIYYLESRKLLEVPEVSYRLLNVETCLKEKFID